MKLILIGAGQRGMIYAQYALEERGVQIVAIADPDAGHLQRAGKLLGVPADALYSDAEKLLALPKLADAAIIASMDRDHCKQAIAAMERGYDILLEKPISPVAEECLRVAEKARETGRRIVVCHVLRYSPFFREIKNVLASGELGRIESIQHNENIGNFHMAHSFVRGNWRSGKQSSPIIMQKSCHDLDLLVWFTDSTCKRVSSFGELSYFKADNAPQGAAERCRDCPYRRSCTYSAYLCYLPVRGDWPATVLTEDQSETGLQRAIDEGPYGRCVFHCDNDVCDHQTTLMEFENGVTATFNLSAFTGRISRTLKIMCEKGEIRASEDVNRIEVLPFGSSSGERAVQRVIVPQVTQGAHGGGDVGLMNDFLALLNNQTQSVPSDVFRSVESHLMACAAEEARVSHTVVDMDGFRRGLRADA